MGVAPYTFRNENSVLPAGFKRGSNPPTTATRHCRIQTVLHYRHGRATHWQRLWMSRAGGIWPPDLVDDDEVGYASAYARAFAAWPA